MEASRSFTKKIQFKSWQELQSTLMGRRKTVYTALANHPMTLFELKDYLGWEINSVSGRVTELADMGVIEACGTKINPLTKKAGTVWKIKNAQLALFEGI